MKVLAFGEILVRMSAPGYNRFLQTDSFLTTYTGAEANICVFLSLNGVKAEFLTKLPVNDIAECSLAALHKYGVHTDHVLRGGDRIGLYYIERGASQRPSKLVYDRKYSSIALAQPEEFDWDVLLEGVDLFTFSGITPALGGALPQICKAACEAAKRKRIPIVADLNYRGNLWTPAEARRVMCELTPYVDILVGNEDDADKCLGIKPKNTDVTKGELNKESYLEVAREISETFGCKTVAFTLRTSFSASDNGWAGMLYRSGEAYFSKEYRIHLVDRVGGGDSFTSGLIYAMLHQYDAQKSIDFAVAASCLKQTIEMDFNLTSVAEIERLANGDASGRVQR